MYGDIELIGVVPKDPANEESTIESQTIARANLPKQSTNEVRYAYDRCKTYSLRSLAVR